MQSQQGSTTNEPDLRPKALRYAAQINAAEKMIVDALPDIIAKLVSSAKEGDNAAARYLIDRVFGRIPRLPHAPAIDNSLPYTSHDWAYDSMRQKQRRDDFWRTHLPSTSAPSGIPGVATPSTADATIAQIAAEFKRRTSTQNGPAIDRNRRR